MIHKSDPGQAPTDTAQPDGSDDSLDMSMGTIPEEWVAAAEDSVTPPGDYTPLSRVARFEVIPVGHREGTFVANIAAVGSSLLCGFLWYLFDLVGLYSGPWLAPVIGIIIAAAVRITSGTEPAYRALLSVASYVLTLMVVLIMLTHQDLSAIYESVDNFQVYEDTLVRNRLQNPVHIAAYVIGALIAGQVGYLRPRD